MKRGDKLLGPEGQGYEVTKDFEGSWRPDYLSAFGGAPSLDPPQFRGPDGELHPPPLGPSGFAAPPWLFDLLDAAGHGPWRSDDETQAPSKTSSLLLDHVAVGRILHSVSGAGGLVPSAAFSSDRRDLDGGSDTMAFGWRSRLALGIARAYLVAADHDDMTSTGLAKERKAALADIKRKADALAQLLDDERLNVDWYVQLQASDGLLPVQVESLRDLSRASALALSAFEGAPFAGDTPKAADGPRNIMIDGPSGVSLTFTIHANRERAYLLAMAEAYKTAFGLEATVTADSRNRQALQDGGPFVAFLRAAEVEVAARTGQSAPMQITPDSVKRALTRLRSQGANLPSRDNRP